MKPLCVCPQCHCDGIIQDAGINVNSGETQIYSTVFCAECSRECKLLLQIEVPDDYECQGNRVPDEFLKEAKEVRL